MHKQSKNTPLSCLWCLVYFLLFTGISSSLISNVCFEVAFTSSTEALRVVQQNLLKQPGTWPNLHCQPEPYTAENHCVHTNSTYCHHLLPYVWLERQLFCSPPSLVCALPCASFCYCGNIVGNVCFWKQQTIDSAPLESRGVVSNLKCYHGDTNFNGQFW